MNALTTKESGNWKTETQVDRAMENYSRKVLTGEAESVDQAEFERMVAWRRTRLVELVPVRRLAKMRRWLEKAG